MTAKEFLEMLIKEEGENAKGIILDTDSWHYEWTPKEDVSNPLSDKHTSSCTMFDRSGYGFTVYRENPVNPLYKYTKTYSSGGRDE